MDQRVNSVDQRSSNNDDHPHSLHIRVHIFCPDLFCGVSDRQQPQKQLRSLPQNARKPDPRICDKQVKDHKGETDKGRLHEIVIFCLFYWLNNI